MQNSSFASRQAIDFFSCFFTIFHFFMTGVRTEKLYFCNVHMQRVSLVFYKYWIFRKEELWLCALESFQEDLCWKMKLLRTISFFPFCLAASPVQRMVVQCFSELANVRIGISPELGFRFSKIQPFCLNSGTCWDIINTSQVFSGLVTILAFKRSCHFIFCWKLWWMHYRGHDLDPT